MPGRPPSQLTASTYLVPLLRVGIPLELAERLIWRQTLELLGDDSRPVGHAWTYQEGHPPTQVSPTAHTGPRRGEPEG